MSIDYILSAPNGKLIAYFKKDFFIIIIDFKKDICQKIIRERDISNYVNLFNVASVPEK